MDVPFGQWKALLDDLLHQLGRRRDDRAAGFAGVEEGLLVDLLGLGMVTNEHHIDPFADTLAVVPARRNAACLPGHGRRTVSRWWAMPANARETKNPASLQGFGAFRKHRISRFGGLGRNRTGVHGFAGRCMTTLPPGQVTLHCETGVRFVRIRLSQGDTRP